MVVVQLLKVSHYYRVSLLLGRRCASQGTLRYADIVIITKAVYIIMVDFDSLFPSLQPPDFKEGATMDDITNPNVKLEDSEVQNNYYYNLGGEEVVSTRTPHTIAGL